MRNMRELRSAGITRRDAVKAKAAVGAVLAPARMYEMTGGDNP